MSSEEEIVQQVVESYATIEDVIVFPLATLSLMFLVYGIYIIIFGLSIHVLWHRHAESSASKAYMRWIIALFILITIQNASIVWLYVDEALMTFNATKTKDYIPYFKYLTGTSSLSVNTAQLGLVGFSSGIASFVFDYLMVHRCYIIWGYNKWILYPTACVVIVTDTITLVAAALNLTAHEHVYRALFAKTSTILDIVTITSAVNTSLLTLLTAGHIWWTVRQVEQITGSSLYTRYKIFIATILESGFLYSTTTVVGVVLPLMTDPTGYGRAPLDLGVISAQMAGIAPTLMIMRITYGQAVESVQQMVSTLHFAEGVDNTQHQSMAPNGMANLQQSLVAVNTRGTVGRIEMEQDKPPSNVAENVV